MQNNNVEAVAPHESLYFQVAPLFLATLVMLTMVIVGVTLAADKEASRQWAIRFIVTGVSIGMVGVLSLPFCISRRRWRVTAQGVLIGERLAVLPRSLMRESLIKFDDILEVSQTFVGARETIALTVRGGKTFLITAHADSPLMQQLLVAVSRARGVALKVQEKLGFWASKTAMFFVSLAIVISAILAVSMLWAFLDGGIELSGGSAGSTKGMVIVLLLPFGLLYVLRQIIRRRKRVLAQHAN
jgi:hypothetical protein